MLTPRPQPNPWSLTLQSPERSRAPLRLIWECGHGRVAPCGLAALLGEKGLREHWGLTKDPRASRGAAEAHSRMAQMKLTSC